MTIKIAQLSLCHKVDQWKNIWVWNYTTFGMQHNVKLLPQSTGKLQDFCPSATLSLCDTESYFHYYLCSILLFSDNVSMDFSGQSGPMFKGTKVGRCYLTTHRMIFNNNKATDPLQSFSFPFVSLNDVSILSGRNELAMTFFNAYCSHHMTGYFSI